MAFSTTAFVPAVASTLGLAIASIMSVMVQPTLESKENLQKQLSLMQSIKCEINNFSFRNVSMSTVALFLLPLLDCCSTQASQSSCSALCTAAMSSPCLQIVMVGKLISVTGMVVLNSCETEASQFYGLLAADSSSISPNVVVCLFVVYQVEKLLTCLITAC